MCLKPGDKVRVNNKFGLESKYVGQVFTVASEPWAVGDMELVKLKGQRGATRVDGLEVVEDARGLKG